MSNDDEDKDVISGELIRAYIDRILVGGEFPILYRNFLGTLFFFPSPPFFIIISPDPQIQPRISDHFHPWLCTPRVCVILMRFPETLPDAQMLPNPDCRSIDQ